MGNLPRVLRIFLTGYLRVLQGRKREQRFWLIALFLLGYLYYPFNPNAGGEFVFASTDRARLAALVKELYPVIRILILTTFARPGYLRRALDAGAIGYLLKDCPSTEMAEAVRRVARGELVIDPGLAAESWSADAGPLTEREREVLRRAGEGESTAELAKTLRLTEGTIRNYLSEAISKVGAHNRTEAVRIARGKGWL